MKTITMKVSQFEHANQFIIEDGNYIYFQSYSSLIARKDRASNELIVGRDWDYSNTTLKHFYRWLECYAPSVWACISNATNKRKAFQELLDNGFVIYCEDMR